MNVIRILTRIAGFSLVSASLLMFLSGCSGDRSFSEFEGAISGQIIAPGGPAAPVYILAIPDKNKGILRKIETESMPFHSSHVAGYTRIQGPGVYTIAGLKDGDYVLWAWMDMNANGGVENHDFAEPVGWYQSDSRLTLNTLTIANGEKLSGKDINLYQPTPYPAGETRVEVGSGGGILKTIKGNKTIILWGTGNERAKAMGRILAPQILDWINFVLIENYSRSAEYYENHFLATVKKNLGGWRRIMTSFSPWWRACVKAAQACIRFA
jgi:hypothetical protein